MRVFNAEAAHFNLVPIAGVSHPLETLVFLYFPVFI